MAKSEFDTTKFVNIDDEDFTGYFNASKEPNGWTVKAGEERTLIVSMAEVFSKHLVDKILQKRGIKDSMRDTDLRRSLFSQILPELQTTYTEAKPLSKDEEIAALKKELERQARASNETMEKKADKDDIEALKKEIEALKAAAKKAPEPEKGKSAEELAKMREEHRLKVEAEAKEKEKEELAKKYPNLK